jgi:hypothetical protein
MKARFEQTAPPKQIISSVFHFSTDHKETGVQLLYEVAEGQGGGPIAASRWKAEIIWTKLASRAS